MEQIIKEVVVYYTVQQMFDLVADIDNYHNFIPWCKESSVKNIDEEKSIGTLLIKYLALNLKFTTTNTKKKYEYIKLELLDGPFKHLDGIWQFKQLNEKSQVGLILTYEFNNKIFAKIANPIFHYIGHDLIHSFVLQANKIYGNLLNR